MFICIAPTKQKSSEVLAAKLMSLSFFANVSMKSDEIRSSTGSLFHVAGPDPKLRRPMVVLVPGTTSVLRSYCLYLYRCVWSGITGR